MDTSLSKFREFVMDRESGVCDPWGRKELNITEQLNWTEKTYKDRQETESMCALSVSQALFRSFAFTVSQYSSAMVLLWIKLVAARGGGEGNGTPLQYFCLENPMDGGAW